MHDGEGSSRVKWCTGLPVEARTKYGGTLVDASPYEFRGTHRVGGCLLAFRSEDDLQKHLQCTDFPCISPTLYSIGL
jgi:hypothetical protein